VTASNLRILTVSHFFEAHGGGIERVAGHLCRQFAQLGHQASWGASGSDPGLHPEVEAVPLACVNPIERLAGLPMPLPGLRAMKALRRAIRTSDVVVIHDALYATSILAMVLAKFHRKRTVLIQHIAGIPFSSRLLRLIMALANRLVTGPMLVAADARVFISDTVRHDLVGTPPRRACTLLFNGVDHGVFHPATNRPPARTVPAQSTGRRVLFVGRYVEKKGLSVLRALAGSRPDLEILMAGAGPVRPERWGLPNVHDLGNQTPQSLANLYRAADLLLLPSVGEGYPLVIQEAMASGLPVVCGAPSDRADPNAAAWLRGVVIDLADPGGSAARCAEAIDRHALSVAQRASMVQYARDRYDWRKMAEGVIDLARGARSSAIDAICARPGRS
jgi:glycosyltransferase involved in cell wall biosynthesis